MATGIQAGGTDLDSLFLPLETTKRSDVGWKSNGGVDISNRFEPYASGAKVATTNLQSGGTDLADLFQNIAVPLTVVTLSNHTTLFTTDPSGVRGGIRFNSDGTIDRRTDAAYTQINSGTDWIIPNGEAPSDYEIRLSSYTTGVFGTEAAAVGTWVALSSSREWNRLVGALGAYDVVANFEIRKGTGSVIDSCVITFNWTP